MLRKQIIVEHRWRNYKRMLKLRFYEVFVTRKNYVCIMEKGIAQNGNVLYVTQITWQPFHT